MPQRRLQAGQTMSDAPQISRVRHELKRRRLTVARVERRPSNMLRVVLRGEELRGFTSLGFDDHVKLIFPATKEGGTDAPAMRDFTPRRFDQTKGELWIDFFLHDAGPAATWAAQATAGQTLEVGGPKGSAIIALDGIDAHVLIGDETALPAIGRRLEELSAGSPALVIIESDARAEPPALSSRGPLDVVWLPRDEKAGPPAQQIIDALRELPLPPGQCFFWVAVESHSARAIRNYLRNERGIDKRWIKAAGYWQRGTVGTHDTLSEEP
jgi:NADPH-dependent ferric siderophore reductase